MTTIQFRMISDPSKISDASVQHPRSYELKWGQSPHILPLNRCVYCGSTDELSDEHTVPYSLWGINKLQRASCSQCRVLIQKIEDYFYKDLLKKPREVLGAPTRKAKKTGRWTGTEKVFDSAANEHLIPTAWAGPLLLLPYGNYLPRMITDEPSLSKHEHRHISVTDFVGETTQGQQELTLPKLHIDTLAVERCIVKIAYCEFIRNFDENYFNKEISKFITHGIGESSLIIGAEAPSETNERLHEIGFRIIQKSIPRINAGKHIVAKVRLFSFLTTPTYFVWLGSVPDGKNYPVSTVLYP